MFLTLNELFECERRDLDQTNPNVIEIEIVKVKVKVKETKQVELQIEETSGVVNKVLNETFF